MNNTTIDITKIISVETIPTNIDFVGYYWLSDETRPVKVDGLFINPQNGVNPYIVEGNLYCKIEETEYSISIKNTGERATVKAREIPSEVKGEIEFTKQNYVTHRLDGVKKVKFKQAWQALSDEYCEGLDEAMNVLVPTWRAFVGFETKKEEDK